LQKKVLKIKANFAMKKNSLLQKVFVLVMMSQLSSCDLLLVPMPTPNSGTPKPSNPTPPKDPIIIPPPPPLDPPKDPTPKPDKTYTQHGVKPPTSAEAASLRVVDMDGTPCDIVGNAKRANDREQNIKKNRYTFPKDADFDLDFSLEALLTPAPNNDESTRFDDSKAGILRGYVFDVKGTDSESCNCGSTNKKYQDIHIVLTPNEKQTAKKYHIVVEITPRMALFMEKRQVDWSLATVKALEGHYVEFKGWLFYDRIHEGEAFANDPQDNTGRKNWRASAWEVHPVTDLRLIKQ
jgi:hypothetical protein